MAGFCSTCRCRRRRVSEFCSPETPIPMKKQAIDSSNPIFATADGSTIFKKFGYSPAVRAGDFLYVAGQIGLNPDGSMPANDEGQIVNAFDRLKIVVEEAGACSTISSNWSATTSDCRTISASSSRSRAAISASRIRPGPSLKSPGWRGRAWSSRSRRWPTRRRRNSARPDQAGRQRMSPLGSR